MAEPGGSGPIGPYPPGVEGEEAQDDYDRLRQSGKMFCRKVVTGKSDALVRMIDRDREAE